MKPDVLARVLVVDDQPDVADALVSFARSLGHVARAAYEPGPALEVARALDPDIAFVDLRLRSADGRQLAASLRSERPSVRLIAMSGYEVDRDSDPCGQVFDDFVLKPPQTEALLRLLRDFRGKPRDR